MKRRYQGLHEKLRAQMRVCRDREIRQKVELFYLAEKLGNVREACSRRGVSSKFFYKWFDRLKREHWSIQALHELSRRPRRSPKQISRCMEAKILFFRRRHYGTRMIREMLRREGISISSSTIAHVLNRRKRRAWTRRKKKWVHRRRYELVIPGERFQIDVKYVPYPVGNEKAYTYVAIDECTRWRYARAYSELNEYMTLDFLNRLNKASPFPIFSIQTDHGQEFTNRLFGNKSASDHLLKRWCRKFHVQPRLIPAGEKELNGKVERSHRIDEQYFYWRAPLSSLEKFNSALERWIFRYNNQRPHGGIGYLTPAEKLEERFNTLTTTRLEGDFERFRLRFLSEMPIRQSREQKLMAQIDRELASLYSDQ